MNGTPPFVGSYIPDQSFAGLIGKSGASVNGVWRLHVVDNFIFGTGSLECWSLELSPTVCTEGGGDCSTDIAVSGLSYTPSLPISGSNMTFTVTVTNLGPQHRAECHHDRYLASRHELRLL